MDELNDRLVQLLNSLGLSEKEIELYSVLIKLKKATVSEITKTAGINRTSGYHVLNRLVAFGLVKLAGNKPKEYYQLQPFDKIIDLAKKNLRSVESRLNIANSVMPQLKSLYEK